MAEDAALALGQTGEHLGEEAGALAHRGEILLPQPGDALQRSHDIGQRLVVRDDEQQVKVGRLIVAVADGVEEPPVAARALRGRG